jgi:ubiquitin carboxyl-terminal hydrolase 36/42
MVIQISQMLFSYKNFVELYSFNKLELHPFGLYNLGNR